MSQFIIATHSYLANGYQSSICFFDKTVSNVHFINAYIDDQNNFTNKLKQLLNKFSAEQVFVLTDLPGGSVNKEAISLLEKYNCKVVSGINLPLVLELVLSTDKKFSDEKIRSVVKQAQEQLIFVNDLLKEEGIE